MKISILLIEDDRDMRINFNLIVHKYENFNPIN